MLNCPLFLLNRVRHAKSRDPGILDPGHFWWKIRTFFRNQHILGILSKFCFDIEKLRFQWVPISLYSCIKHHIIDSWNPLFRELFQVNCPDISKPKIGSRTKIIFLHGWVLDHSKPIQEQIKSYLEKINYYFHIFTILEWMKLGVLN